MTKINGDTEVKDFGGNVVVSAPPVNKPMTIGPILEQYVGSWMAENKDQVFAATALGLKLHEANKTKQPIELDDVEFKLLKETLEQIKHPVLVMNAVYDTLGIEKPNA